MKVQLPMKKEKEIAVHLIIEKCNKNLINNVTDKFKKKLNELNKSNITIGIVKKCWKIPKTCECFLFVHFSQKVTIMEVINLFKLQWYYSNNTDSEEAIWSKLEEPKNIFIDKSILWVHIYPSKFKKNSAGKNLIIHDISDGIYAAGNTKSSKLALLGDFLVEDVGTKQSNTLIKNILNKSKIIIKLNCCSLIRKKENLHLNYQFMSNYDDLIITTKKLIDLIQKWNNLVNIGRKKIILSEENGEIKILEK